MKKRLGTFLEWYMGEGFGLEGDPEDVSDMDIGRDLEIGKWLGRNGWIDTEGKFIDIGGESHQDWVVDRGFRNDKVYGIKTGNIRWSGRVIGMTVYRRMSREQVEVVRGIVGLGIGGLVIDYIKVDGSRGVIDGISHVDIVVNEIQRGVRL